MGTYLGIQEDITRSKCKLFAFLKDKLMNRVNGWTVDGSQKEERKF